MGYLREASPPPDADRFEQQMRHALRQTGTVGSGDDEGRPLTATVGATVNPRPGARYVPAEAILVPRDKARLLDEPLVIAPEPSTSP